MSQEDLPDIIAPTNDNPEDTEDGFERNLFDLNEWQDDEAVS
jgi:hypothetical protein